MQIGRRRRAHQEKHPDARIISLGIGDTTEPIPKSIAEAMQKAAAGMATLEGYSGWATAQDACPGVTSVPFIVEIWLPSIPAASQQNNLSQLLNIAADAVAA